MRKYDGTKVWGKREGGVTTAERTDTIRETIRDVHFHQKMQSVIAQKPILTLQVECLAS